MRCITTILGGAGALLLVVVLGACGETTRAEIRDDAAAHEETRAGDVVVAHTCRKEHSVSNGLGVQSWELNHQDPRGFWSSDGFARQCCVACGPCGDPGAPGLDVAVTALMVNGLVSVGYDTQRPSPWRAGLVLAMDYLGKSQKENGRWSEGNSLADRLTDAWATMASSAAYSSHKKLVYRSTAERAVRALGSVKDVTTREDVTVAAWSLVACIEARDGSIEGAGAEVDRLRALLEDKVIARAEEWNAADARSGLPRTSMSTAARALSAWCLCAQPSDDVDDWEEQTSERLMSWATRGGETGEWTLASDDLMLVTRAFRRLWGRRWPDWQKGCIARCKSQMATNGCARGSLRGRDACAIDIGAVGALGCWIAVMNCAYARRFVFGP